MQLLSPLDKQKVPCRDLPEQQHCGGKGGKFLRILCGCHAIPERSFWYRGKPFPICARCTGELAGILMGILIVCIIGYPKFGIIVLMMIPLVVDGMLQKLTSYESQNGRRLITGILFGIALVFLFLYFHQMCIGIAGSILKWIGLDPVTVDGIMKRFCL